MTRKQSRRLYTKFRNSNPHINRVSAKQAFKTFLEERG